MAEARPVKRFRCVTQAQRAIFSNHGYRVLCSGPWGSGKTTAICAKLVWLASRYPGLRIAAYRRHTGTALVKLYPEIRRWIPDDAIAKESGGSIVFRNGSQIDVTGLESGEKGTSKEGGSNYAVIYVNEAVEVPESLYNEQVGRSARVASFGYTQIILDCNPESKRHWLYRQFYESGDQDCSVINCPTLPASCGLLSPQYYRFLAGLAGVAGRRYRDGLWCGQEGEVYPYDPKLQLLHPTPSGYVDGYGNVIAPNPLPAAWRAEAAVDFGFDHPFVWGLFRRDSMDRLFLQRQHYMTRRPIGEHAAIILRECKRLNVNPAAWHDPSGAQAAADLRSFGVNCQPADNSVVPGIGAVYELFPREQADGTMSPCRFFILADSLVERDEMQAGKGLPTCLQDELPGYRWASTAKEQPVKEQDDGCDMLRYAVYHVDPMIHSVEGWV